MDEIKDNPTVNPGQSQDEFGIIIHRTETKINRIKRERPKQEHITYLGQQDNQHEEVLFENPQLLNSMTAYLRSDLEVELAGILVGQFCKDSSGRSFTIITDFLPDNYGIGREGTYTFTPNSWSNAIMEVEKLDNKQIIGWVHSHPSNGFPPKPSDPDLFIIKEYFNRPEFITMILGRGGNVNNLYAVYRYTPDGVRPQKGIGIVGASDEITRRYGYFYEDQDVKSSKLEKDPGQAPENNQPSLQPLIRITEEDLRS